MPRLSTKLVLGLIVVAALAPTGVAIVDAAIRISAAREARLDDDVRRQAAIASLGLDRLMATVETALTTVSRSDLKIEQGAACDSKLAALLAGREGFAALALLSAGGEVTCASSPEARRVATAFADTMLTRTLNAGTFVTGGYVPPAGDRGAGLSVALPFDVASGRPAVLVAAIDLAWLGGRVSQLGKLGPGEHLVVSDRDGVILARAPETSEILGAPLSHDARPLPMASREGVERIRTRDGEAQIMGYIPAAASRSGLFVGVAIEPMRSTTDLDGALVVPIVALGLGAALGIALALWASVRLVERPIAAMRSVASRWATGDFSRSMAPVSVPSHDYAALASSLDALAAGRREDGARIAELEQQASTQAGALSQLRDQLQVAVGARQKSEAALVQRKELSALGRFAIGTAHEINNQLTTVLGALDLLSKPSGAEQPGGRLIERAITAAERSANVVAQVIRLDERLRRPAAPVDVNAMVDELAMLLTPAMPAGVRLETRLDVTLPKALAQGGRLESALVAFIADAAETTTEGTIRIETSLDATEPADWPASAPSVAITLSRPSVGDAEHEAARRSAAEIAARQAGAMFRFGDDKPGEFVVNLLVPAAKPGALNSERPNDQGVNPVSRTERVLLVDDDPDVLEMVGEMLVDSGYEVALASSGAEALALLDRDPSLSILLSDYAMPEMHGLSLIEAARTRRPHLRVLMMTGYADMRAVETFGTERVLRKPFSMGTLAERMRRLGARSSEMSA